MMSVWQLLALVGGARLRFKFSRGDGVAALVNLNQCRSRRATGWLAWRGCAKKTGLASCKSLAGIHTFASEFFDQCAARACDSDWRN